MPYKCRAKILRHWHLDLLTNDDCKSTHIKVCYTTYRLYGPTRDIQSVLQVPTAEGATFRCIHTSISVTTFLMVTLPGPDFENTIHKNRFQGANVSLGLKCLTYASVHTATNTKQYALKNQNRVREQKSSWWCNSSNQANSSSQLNVV